MEDFEIGCLVKVIDIEGYTKEQLQIDSDDFQEVLSKILDGNIGVIFDVDEDDERFVDVVFDDGIEIYGICTSRLMLVVDDDYYMVEDALDA